MQQLLYFVTVVEQKTFTKAATILHISQPSLSAAIKKLENEIGLTLLVRSTRKLSVTKEGEVLYNEAKKLLLHFEHIKNEMKRLKEQGPLELSIGFIESSKFWIPKVIPDFRKEFDNVHIKLLEILGLKEVQVALNQFFIHIAITNQYLYDPNIKTIPLYEEKLVALIPVKNSLHKKAYIKLDDLEGEDFIISKEGFQTREDILNAFQKKGVKPNIQFEFERLETACSLVEDNLGIALIPENYVRYLKNKTYHIREIKNSHISRMVYLAYVKNRYLPPLVKYFINLVREFLSGKQSD